MFAIAFRRDVCAKPVSLLKDNIARSKEIDTLKKILSDIINRNCPKKEGKEEVKYY